jgi:hypothetical protein
MKPNYGHDRSGKKLSQAERIERAQAEHRRTAKPKPEPAVLQRQDTLRAEREGRNEARAKTAAPQNPNPYRRQYDELAKTAITAADFKQLQRYKRWAKQWERDNAERIEREAKVAELKESKSYHNALEHAQSFMRTPPHEDDAVAAAAAFGYLDESGDVSGYWAKVAEIEHARWAEEDAKLNELAKNSVLSRAALTEQATKTEEAATRLRSAQEQSQQ